jgi:hypothetical protein
MTSHKLYIRKFAYQYWLVIDFYENKTIYPINYWSYKKARSDLMAYNTAEDFTYELENALEVQRFDRLVRNQEKRQFLLKYGYPLDKAAVQD